MSISLNASALNLYQTQSSFSSVSTNVKSTSSDDEESTTSSVMAKKLEEAEESLEEESTDDYTSTSVQGDTLSLSQEGLSAQEAGASVVTSSDSSSSSSDLSSYTEAQLKKMLDNGEITQAQYNAEMKSRTEDDSDSSSSSETGVPSEQATEIQMDVSTVQQLASM